MSAPSMAFVRSSGGGLIDWSVSQYLKNTPSPGGAVPEPGINGFRYAHPRIGASKVCVMPLIASLQLGTFLIIVVLVALPVGALVFAMGAGSALQRIGKGQFALEQDFPQSSGGTVHAVSAEVREEEIRQMVQARSDRGVAKGRE